MNKAKCSYFSTINLKVRGQEIFCFKFRSVFTARARFASATKVADLSAFSSAARSCRHPTLEPLFGNMAMKLTYFNVRGLAEVSRYMLHMGGATYEDFRLPIYVATFAKPVNSHVLFSDVCGVSQSLLCAR